MKFSKTDLFVICFHQGLGAQEHGSTEHIKVQVKNNTLGLGASVSQEVSGGNRIEATQTRSSSAYTHTCI